LPWAPAAPPPAATPTAAAAATAARCARPAPAAPASANNSLSLLLRNRAFWLSTLGYSGHNWELYALWLWFKRFSHDAGIGALLAGSSGSSADGSATAAAAAAAAASSGDSLAAFLVVSSAFIGCTLGGLAADRVGRTTVCLCSLAVSIVGSLTIGLTMGHPALTLAVGLVWGVFAVAESAQFSAMTAELVPAELVGNAVTLQFGIGFLCTMPGMFLVPMLAPPQQDIGAAGDDGGGSWALAWGSLAPGTVIGAIAMLALRRRPEAWQVARLRGRPAF
jgi:MFS family permease